MGMIIGLKMAILRSGRSQWEIARDIGISETRLSRILRGRVEVRDEEREALARILGATMGELFDELVPAKARSEA